MGKKNIIILTIELMVEDWEFVFPMSAERNECWNFVHRWMKFVMDPDARTFDCDGNVKVWLHGFFSNGDIAWDEIGVTTTAIRKVEKISPPEHKSLITWLWSRMFWPKRINQVYQFTVESGSAFTVRAQDAAVETLDQLWVARFGASDELVYRRAFA